jgi:predicted nucleic acid-binding protein
MAEAKTKRRALRARDAIIAATAEANALAVLTRDRDFQRFGAGLVILGLA